MRNGSKVHLFNDITLPGAIPVKASAYVLPKLGRKGSNITIAVCVD